MKRKSRKKRIIALFCAVFMLFETANVMLTSASATLEESFTTVTFSKFGISSGAYETNDPATGLAFCGAYDKSLDKTVFSGDISFPSEEVWFQYGFKTDTWECLRFQSVGDGTIVLHNAFTGEDIATLTEDDAGIPLVNNRFNLKISIEFVDISTDSDADKDDVKLGIWFEDKLYNEEFFYVENLASVLGDSVAVCLEQEPSNFQAYSVALNEKKETLSSALKGITLKNFDIADGKYQYTKAGSGQKGFETNGGYAFSLDKTYFSADVVFSSVSGADFRFGGATDPWLGLRFDVVDDAIRLCDAAFSEEEGDKIYYFESELAGVKLTDNKFNLKLSTEYVDSDGDGATDDVKFGVWFNNVLYNNEYIYFPNYALEMGGNLTICASEDAPTSSISMWSDEKLIPKLDFTLFGFTNNWDKELGEEL